MISKPVGMIFPNAMQRPIGERYRRL